MDSQKLSFNELDLINSLSRVKRHITAIPTNTPRNFYEMIEFYDDGTNQRMYFYVNNNWRYTTLT